MSECTCGESWFHARGCPADPRFWRIERATDRAGVHQPVRVEATYGAALALTRELVESTGVKHTFTAISREEVARMAWENLPPVRVPEDGAEGAQLTSAQWSDFLDAVGDASEVVAGRLVVDLADFDRALAARGLTIRAEEVRVSVEARDHDVMPSKSDAPRTVIVPGGPPSPVGSIIEPALAPVSEEPSLLAELIDSLAEEDKR